MPEKLGWVHKKIGATHRMVQLAPSPATQSVLMDVAIRGYVTLAILLLVVIPSLNSKLTLWPLAVGAIVDFLRNTVFMNFEDKSGVTRSLAEADPEYEPKKVQAKKQFIIAFRLSLLIIIGSMIAVSKYINQNYLTNVYESTYNIWSKFNPRLIYVYESFKDHDYPLRGLQVVFIMSMSMMLFWTLFIMDAMMASKNFDIQTGLEKIKKDSTLIDKRSNKNIFSWLGIAEFLYVFQNMLFYIDWEYKRVLYDTVNHNYVFLIMFVNMLISLLFLSGAYEAIALRRLIIHSRSSLSSNVE